MLGAAVAGALGAYWLAKPITLWMLLCLGVALVSVIGDLVESMKVVSQLELLLPMPEKFRNSARFSAFFDIGNVFSTDSTKFVGRDRITPVDYNFSDRKSVV